MERGRHHLADLRAARHRPARLCPEQYRDQLQLRVQRVRRLGHRHRDGRLALDQPGRAVVLRRTEVDPRRLLSGRADRRRLALGGVHRDPAAEDASRAADRRAAALHGQFHDLHRAVRGHRRRPRQFDDVHFDRTGQDRARPIRPRQGRGVVAGLQSDHHHRVLDILHRHDQRRRRAASVVKTRESHDAFDSRPPPHPRAVPDLPAAADLLAGQHELQDQRGDRLDHDAVAAPADHRQLHAASSPTRAGIPATSTR